jgi:DNA polymerase-4
VFVPPRFDVYKAVSQQIHTIFARYTCLIQPLSLDEAYLDVTAPLIDRGSATAIAAEIRTSIRAETDLTASAGVSYNKFLAKLASDHRKADGLFVITPRMGPSFVEDLPVGKFHGVGPVTAARMNALGIHTGLDLRRQSPCFFGRTLRQGGRLLLRRGAWSGRSSGRSGPGTKIGRGRDHVRARPDTMGADGTGAGLRFRQGLGGLRQGRTCRTNRNGEGQTCRLPSDHAQPVLRRTGGITARTGGISLELLRPCFPPPRGVRLLGVTISNLDVREERSRAQLAFLLKAG